MNLLLLPEDIEAKEKDEYYWKTLYLLCYQVIHKGIDTIIYDLEKVQQQYFPHMDPNITDIVQESE